MRTIAMLGLLSIGSLYFADEASAQVRWRGYGPAYSGPTYSYGYVTPATYYTPAPSYWYSDGYYYNSYPTNRYYYSGYPGYSYNYGYPAYYNRGGAFYRGSNWGIGVRW